jgi:hypothetical protein
LRAALTPPRGFVFLGTLSYWDDFYQYLSFVEQAARGSFIFFNKFDFQPHVPAFVNVEWGLAGLLGALLGGPLAGFHALRLLALWALVAGAFRALQVSGRSGASLGWALALFLTGGGLGGLQALFAAPDAEIADLRAGFFPFHQCLSNPHFVTGLALLLWSVVWWAEWRRGQAPAWRFVASGWALGLSRPFDLGTFLMLGGAAFVLDLARKAGPRVALRRVLPLAAFLPLVAYQAAVLGRHPSFATWSGAQNQVPEFGALALAAAFAPAALLAIYAGWRSPTTPLREAFGLWAGVLVLLPLARTAGVVPNYVVTQSLVTLGAALLAFAASALPQRVLPWATLALAPTSLALLHIAWFTGAVGFAPRDYFATADFLKGACRDGDVALGSAEVGLIVAARSPCRVVLGHTVLTPHFAEREAEVAYFYAPTTPAAERRRLLDFYGARFVILRAGADDFLGESPEWKARFATPLLEVWERSSSRTAAGQAGNPVAHEPQAVVVPQAAAELGHHDVRLPRLHAVVEDRVVGPAGLDVVGAVARPAPGRHRGLALAEPLRPRLVEAEEEA